MKNRHGITSRCRELPLLIWLLITCAGPVQAFAQSRSHESSPATLVATSLSELGRVQTQLLATKLPDSTGLQRLRLLLVLADQNRATQDQAIPWLQEAAQLLLELQSQVGPQAFTAETALVHALQCDFRYRSTPAVQEYDPCNKLQVHLEKVNDPFVRAMLWNTLAIARFREGDFTASLDLSRLALDAARQDGGKLLIARVRTQQGITLLEYGLPDRALESFSDARNILNKENHKTFNLTLSAMIGAAQLQAGHPESALKSLLEGLAWAEEIGANQRAVRLRDMVAQAYLALDQPQTAIRYLEGMFAGPVPDMPIASQIGALNTLARAYALQGRHVQSVDTFERAHALAVEHGDDSRRRTVTLAYAEALSNRKLSDAAIARLEPLATELRTLEPTQPLVKALDVLARAYAQLGNYQGAYQAQSESRELQRHVQSADFERLLSHQRAELELGRQADELSLLRAREQSLKTTSQLNSTILISLIMLGIMSGLLIYLIMSRRLQRQATLVQQKAAEQLETLVIERTQELESELASRLLLQEERRQLEASLAEGDKLRTIGQLTSGVAHDFNNLMTVVTLSAELLDQGGESLSQRQRQCVNDILLASQSGSHVTQGLLAYARQQSLEPESLDLDSYMGQLQPLFQRTLGDGVTLNIDLRPAPLMVDKANLTTALINLMANAGEAMNGRGTVLLEGGICDPADGPPTRSGSNTQWVRIAVTDSGRGMTETERARAIEPFFTTKSGGEGSGLGLSMVYGFAKQSGGELAIQSPIEGGTRIVIWLPCRKDSARQIDSADAPSGSFIRAGTKVLLVEDQEALRQTMRRLLESMGLVVEDADSADAALTMMRSQPPPDLLLSDVVMPGRISGTELADVLRERFPELPVLLMSGYTDLVEIDYPILQKPFSLEELRDKVAVALQAAAA